MASTLKRTGLHRAGCEHDCGAYIYATVSSLERHGCPLCACGGRFVPDHPDLAAAILPDALDAHPAVIAYRRELSSVLHGQAPSVARGRQVRPAEEIAGERVERERRELARARQLSGLRHPSDPIPF